MDIENNFTYHAPKDDQTAMIDSVPAADVVPGVDYRDCRNELCYKCGSYQYNHETHECDECRWRSEKC